MNARRERILRCTTPQEYWEWQGRPGAGPPEVVRGHDTLFCLDAPLDWCRQQRVEGRCCLSDAEFVHIERLDRLADCEMQEEPMAATAVSRTIAARAAERRSTRAEAEREPAATQSRAPAPPSPMTGVTPPRRAWEVWSGQRQSHVRPPTLSIYPSGSIRLSAAALALLGTERPAWIQVLWDPGAHMIGIRPARQGETGARRLSRTQQQHAVTIACAPFIRAYGLTAPRARSWPARLEDGVLVACLAEPYEERRGRPQADAS